MIELSSENALLLYLGITLSMLLGLWLHGHFHSRKKKIVISEQKLQVCEFCHFPYLDNLSKEITKCPQCKCYNK